MIIKFFYASILILLIQSTFSQTANILIRTKDSLIIATDSKVGHLDGRKPDTVCKIIKAGNYYYTFAGYTFENYLLELRLYFNSSDDLESISHQYLANRYNKLYNYLSRLKNNDSAFYKRNFSLYKWSEAIFFGVENNEIKTYLDSGIFAANYEEGEFDYRFGGHHNAMDSLIKKGNVFKDGFIEAIKKLMTAQSHSTPESVSYPIDILVITPKKANWICPCGKCEAISNK